MRIAIASGKGGTGKTTVSVNLFHYIAKYINASVQLIDCDVEEPNAILFFPGRFTVSTKNIYTYVPEIHAHQCTFCRRCADWCSFNAITLIASRKLAVVNKDLCHSCGACVAACEMNAITEIPYLTGTVNQYKTQTGQFIMEGRLQTGSSMQTMLIKKLKQQAPENNVIQLLDAPPGTSCPVVQTLAGSNYIVLVTEPTPFGLHDLKIAVEVVKKLDIPFGVVINKSGLGTEDVYHFLQKEKIELLGQIPFSKAYVRKYSEGKLFNANDRKIEKIYLEIIHRIITTT